jgi:hypothetical protein
MFAHAEGVTALPDPKSPETAGPIAFRDTMPDTGEDEDRTTLPSLGAFQLREQALMAGEGSSLVVIELRIELDRQDSPASVREAVIDAISVCLSQHGFDARIVDGSSATMSARG